MEKEPTQRPITPDELNRFVNANITEPCPRCKNEKWSGNMTGQNVTILCLYPSDEKVLGSDESKFLPFVPLSCTKCGFMSAHNAIIMVNWLEANSG